MEIKCIRQFGNFKQDDKLEVPDGAVFDEFYFVKVEAPAVPAAPVAPAAAPEGGAK